MLISKSKFIYSRLHFLVEILRSICQHVSIEARFFNNKCTIPNNTQKKEKLKMKRDYKYFEKVSALSVKLTQR